MAGADCTKRIHRGEEYPATLLEIIEGNEPEYDLYAGVETVP